MKTIKYILIFFTACLIFSSCEKCKDCTIEYETLNGFDVASLDATAQLLGFTDWETYMNSLYTTEEICDEALDQAEELSDSADLDMDGTADYRVYWDCK